METKKEKIKLKKKKANKLSGKTLFLDSVPEKEFEYASAILKPNVNFNALY